MKHIFLSVYVSAILGAAQAGANATPNSSAIDCSRCDGQQLTVAGAENSDACGNENGHAGGFSADYAVLNDPSASYGAVDCISGINNSYAADVNFIGPAFNGPAAENNFGDAAPVPEQRVYAMLALGLGLLGLGARSRRVNPFD